MKQGKLTDAERLQSKHIISLLTIIAVFFSLIFTAIKVDAWPWSKNKKYEVSDKEVQEIRGKLGIESQFIDSELKNVLNKELDPEKSPGLTYAVYILNALYEEELVESVWTEEYKYKAAEFFNKIAESNSSWETLAKKILKDTLIGVISIYIGKNTSIGISSLFLCLDAAEVGIALKGLKNLLTKNALWCYLQCRKYDTCASPPCGHEIAWRAVIEDPTLAQCGQDYHIPIPILNKDKKLRVIENYFKNLWEKYGQYLTSEGLSIEFKNQQQLEIKTALFKELAPPPTTPPKESPSGCVASVSPDRWKGEYFKDKSLSGNPLMVRDDGTRFLNFDWGTGSPSTGCGVGVDNFSVRWTRTMYFDSGTWRFSVTADDGVRFYVDGSLKIDKWFDQSSTNYTVDLPLSAGNHTIRMEYYESGGQAVAKLSWQKIAAVTPPVSPTVNMSPPSGAVGTTFTQTGKGFTPNNTVTLYGRKPDGSQSQITTLRTDSTGAFSRTWKADTQGNNFAWWAVDNRTNKKSNEVIFSVTSTSSTQKCPGGEEYNQPPHPQNVFTQRYRGYCTWYVADRWLHAGNRDLPSTGNAIKWLEDAKTKFLTGSKPEKGSIVVFGSTDKNPAGHVAYVESISGNGFTIAQMNAGGNIDRDLKSDCFNKVTRDTLQINQSSYKGMRILGFIYPQSVSQPPVSKPIITPPKEPIISKSTPLGPYPSGQKYYLRVFNVDDVSKVKINGREILSVGYYNERELDIKGYLVEGKNSIEFTLENTGGGWTYGYTLRQGNNLIWNETCGRVGIEGCRNNDQTKGIVARHLINLSVAPPTVSPTPICTDGSQFVSDVTIPDNTGMQPGQTFTKTWRLKNTGNCSWGSGYGLVFTSGSRMGAPSSVSVLNTPVNGTADISVPMVAPSSPGAYQGYWQMRNAKGQAFGPQIWVKINVASGPSANLAPNLPTNLFQFKADGVTGMAAGATTNQNTVVLKGGVSDPNNDPVKLQIELKRLDEYGGQFAGSFTQESPLISSGSTATITISGLINGSYHWRGRTVDSKGAKSNWLSAGGNPDSAADFIVSVGPVQPSTPTITSPGSGSEPGQMISTLTPTLQWNAVSGADYYALAISKYPYGTGNIIYNPQRIYGTSHTVPSGVLQYGQKYRWNIQASISGRLSPISNTLYFNISTAVSTTTPNPQIISISPTQVQAGQFTLTINGSNFDSGAIDQFYTPSGQFMGSGAQSGGLVSRSSNQIVVRENLTGTPAGTYTVRVKNSDGKLSGSINIFVSTAASSVQPGPSISSISPTQVQAGQFTLTINGSNFDSGAVDQFYTPSGQYMGSGALSGGLVSRNSNQIIIRENLTGAQAGIYTVRVKNSDGKMSPPASIQVIGTTPPPPPQPTKTVANTGGYGLRLRNAPSINSAVVTTVSEGTRVNVIGGPRTADGYTWWNISTANGTGWSAVGDWLNPAPAVGNTVRVANTGGYGLKLRKNPCINDTQCPKITTLSDGMQVKVSGGPVQADGYTWWNISTSAGSTGWVPVGNWLIP